MQYQIFLALQLYVAMTAEHLQQTELSRSTETIFGVVTEGSHNSPLELHFNIQSISNYIEI